MAILRIILGVVGLLAWAELCLGGEQRSYKSAHYLGRGDTGIGDADDQEAIFYNPAGLARGKGIYKKIVLGSPQVEISSRTKTIYSRLEIEEKDTIETFRDEIGKPFHLGVTSMSALVFRRAALSAVTANGINALVRKAPEYGGLETLNADFHADRMLTFSLAESMYNNHLLVGVTGKYIQRSESEIEASIVDAEEVQDLRDDLVQTGTGRGIDAGLMLLSGPSKRHTEHGLGVTVNNIGQVEFTPDAESEDLDVIKQTVNIGYTLTLGTKHSRFKILADYRDITSEAEDNSLKKIHFGSEINVANRIGVTGGLNQGYPTAGMYVDTYIVRVDAGFYGVERGERLGMYPDTRYFLRLVVGL